MATDVEKVDFNFYPSYADRSFRAYAIAIGELALSWNGLHDSLGRLFSVVIEDKKRSASAIWHSIKSDRAQREVLLAAAERVYSNRQEYPHALDDIKWILSEATKIEDFRNDALHSPVILLGTKRKSRPVPSYYFGHVRATRLKDKDFIREFRKFRNDATKLRDFAAHLTYILLPSEKPASWPRRPKLRVYPGTNK
jgi:hypothetical protein